MAFSRCFQSQRLVDLLLCPSAAVTPLSSLQSGALGRRGGGPSSACCPTACSPRSPFWLCQLFPSSSGCGLGHPYFGICFSPELRAGPRDGLTQPCVLSGCLSEPRQGDTVRYRVQLLRSPRALHRSAALSAPALRVPGQVHGWAVNATESQPLGEHMCAHTNSDTCVHASTHTQACTQPGTQGLDHTARQRGASPGVCSPGPGILLSLLHPRGP